MFSKLLRSAVLAAMAVGATMAQADPFSGSPEGTLVFQGSDTGAYATVYVNGKATNASEYLGTFNPTTDANGGSDFFRFFCIELAEYTWNGLSTTYTRSLGIGDSNKSAQLTQLFDLYYPPLPHPNLGVFSLGNATTNFGHFATTAAAAAMQLAIWEIWEDTGLSLSGGSLIATCADDAVCTGAQTMLSAVGTAVSSNRTPAGDWAFYRFERDRPLYESGNQDFLSATYTNSSGDVPLPGTLALLGIGLAGLGVARRKNTV
jgi:hypothetical protein